MRPLRKAVLISTATVMFFGLAGLSPAGIELRNDRHGDESHAVPFPVVGDYLLSSPKQERQNGNAFCMTADRVLEKFVLDIENVGGDIVLMTEGVQQDFADSWRRLVKVERVEVTLVLAHVIPDRGGDPIIDVVEIDNEGCAVSRTLLTADDWNGLLELARSIEV